MSQTDDVFIPICISFQQYSDNEQSVFGQAGTCCVETAVPTPEMKPDKQVHFGFPLLVFFTLLLSLAFPSEKNFHAPPICLFGHYHCTHGIYLSGQAKHRQG